MEQFGQQSDDVEAMDLSANRAASSSDEQSDQISQGSNYCSYCVNNFNHNLFGNCVEPNYSFSTYRFITTHCVNH